MQRGNSLRGKLLDENNINWWRRMAKSIKSFPICGVLVHSTVTYFAAQNLDGFWWRKNETKWTNFHLDPRWWQHFKLKVVHNFPYSPNANCSHVIVDIQIQANERHGEWRCKRHRTTKLSIRLQIYEQIWAFATTNISTWNTKGSSQRCSSQTTYQRKMRDAVWLAPIATALVRFKCEMIAAVVHSCG